MGGKRPDQYNIDPGEAGATDYKTMGQTGQGRSSMDDTLELDRQRIGEQEAQTDQQAQSGTKSSGAPVPGSKPAPSMHANAALREQSDAESGDDEREREARGNTEAGKDEVGA